MKNNLTKIHNVTLLIMLGIFLIGCSTVADRGPESLNSPPPFACATKISYIEDARTCAFEQAKNYGTRISKINNERSYLYDLPIIGTVIATGASIFYEAHKDTTLGIGLLGAALGGIRSYANIETSTALYRSAQTACQCVGDKLTWFISQVGTVNRLRTAVQNITGANNLLVQAETLLNTGTMSTPVMVALQASYDAVNSIMENGLNAYGVHSDLTTKSASMLLQIDSNVLYEIESKRPKFDTVISSINSSISELKKAKNNDAQSSSDAATAASKETLAIAANNVVLQARAKPPADDQAALALTARLNGITKDINDTASLIIEKNTEVVTCISGG